MALSTFLAYSQTLDPSDESWRCPEQGWQTLETQIDPLRQTDVKLVEEWLRQPDLRDCNKSLGLAWLAESFQEAGQVNEGMELARMGLDSISEPLDKLPLWFSVAAGHQLNADYASEIEQYQIVLDHNIPDQLIEYRINAYLGLAQAHSMQGNVFEAVEWTQEALSQRHKITDKDLVYNILLFSSSVYYFQEWIDEAMSLSQEALALLQTMPDQPSYISRLYDNMAAMEIKRDNLDAALLYLDKELELCDQLAWDYCRYFVYYRRTTVYLLQEEVALAADAIKQAGQYVHHVKEPRLLLGYWIDVALVHAKQNDLEAYREAEKELELLWLKVPYENLNYSADYHQARAKMAMAIGEFEQAANWYRIRGQILEDINRKNSTDVLGKMFAELQIAEHERRAAELEVENQQKAMRLAAAESRQSMQQKMLAYQALALVLGFIVVVFVWLNRRQWRRTAMRDSLTRILNRGGLFRKVRPLMAAHDKLGIILFDLDHFKKVNDKYGHPAGDAVLKTIAHRVKNCVKSSDLVGRVGGEEFMLVICHEDETLFMQIAERVRVIINSNPVITDAGEISVSVSLGVTTMDCRNESISTAYSRADDALYQAKEQGRNRICHAQP